MWRVALGGQSAKVSLPKSLIWTFVSVALGLLCALPSHAQSPPAIIRKRWIHINTNGLVRDRVNKAKDIVRRGAAVGYNGLLLRDTKLSFYRTFDNPQRYMNSMREIIDLARSLGMEVSLGVFPFGYSSGFLIVDPNLASGHPVEKCPMRVNLSGRTLVPVPTAEVENGGFEDISNNRFLGYRFIDGTLGQDHVADTAVKVEGLTSIRFDNMQMPHARIFKFVTVKPLQQYRIRVAMKADRVSANWSAFLIRTPDTRETLYTGHFVLPNQDGSFEQFVRLEDFTSDWFDQGIVFNSQNMEQVEIIFGLWGPQGNGKIWFDNLRVEPVPTLNIIRRSDLPVTLQDSTTGRTYREGRDYARIEDPKLGNIGPYQGPFGVLHDPPTVRLTEAGNFRDGQIVHLTSSCALPVFSNNQMTASMTTPGVFTRMEAIIKDLVRDFTFDSFFFEHDEIRTGGWEPDQRRRWPNAGGALAENLRECRRIIRQHGGGRPMLIWNDMVDPHHNASPDIFYSARVSFDGSWTGLSPDVTIMNWNYFEAGSSLNFFHRRGHKQMIAAFYDQDIQENLRIWVTGAESAGIKNEIEGVMYTTWVDDFGQLENFADAWWSKAPYVPAPLFCFSGRNKVLVRGKGEVSMDQVEVGDHIQVSQDEFEPVYAFAHRRASIKSEFVQIHVDTGSSLPVELSHEHLIRVDGMFVPASTARVGQMIELKDGTNAPIGRIQKVERRGVYNPLTLSGTLLVNGVKVSNYISLQPHSSTLRLRGLGDTGISHHWLSHWFLLPLRLQCHYFGDIGGLCGNSNSDGILQLLVWPHKMASWWLQNDKEGAIIDFMGWVLLPLAMLGGSLWVRNERMKRVE